MSENKINIYKSAFDGLALYKRVLVKFGQLHLRNKKIDFGYRIFRVRFKDIDISSIQYRHVIQWLLKNKLIKIDAKGWCNTYSITAKGLKLIDGILILLGYKRIDDAPIKANTKTKRIDEDLIDDNESDTSDDGWIIISQRVDGSYKYERNRDLRKDIAIRTFNSYQNFGFMERSDLVIIEPYTKQKEIELKEHYKIKENQNDF